MEQVAMLNGLDSRRRRRRKSSTLGSKKALKAAMKVCLKAKKSKKAKAKCKAAWNRLMGNPRSSMRGTGHYRKTTKRNQALV